MRLRPAKPGSRERYNGMNLRRRNPTAEKPLATRTTLAGSGTALGLVLNVQYKLLACGDGITCEVEKDADPLKKNPEELETGGPVKKRHGRIVLAGSTVTSVMVGAPVNSMGDPVESAVRPEATPVP